MTEVKSFDLDGLDAVIRVLAERGFDVIGPTLRDDAVAYGPIASIADLPAKRGDVQTPAHYGTHARADDALFGYAAPVQSARQVFFPADELLWSSRTTTDADGSATPAIRRAEHAGRPVAYVGLRSCDLAAIGQHDRILAGRAHVDVAYIQRRRDAFLVAVTCSNPAGTCFCASLGTGPSPGEGADIAVTEVLDGVHRSSRPPAPTAAPSSWTPSAPPRRPPRTSPPPTGSSAARCRGWAASCAPTTWSASCTARSSRPKRQ